ncbi:MAG: 4Fe-4S dicluster domain-containing protein [Actinomycetota bacterium]
MEIEKTKEIIKSCRYCLMCKHVCPSGSYSYFESDYPRGRALIMDRILEGKNDYTKDMIDALYNCFLCDSCHAHCEGNWELPKAVKMARYDIASRGLEPGRAKKIKESLESFGHPFVGERLKPVEISYERGCKLLYIMGPHIRFKHHSLAEAVKGITAKAGDCFSVMEDEPGCGAVLDMLGYRKEAKKAGKLLFERIKEKSPETILVSDPVLYHCLKNDFAEWGLKFDKRVSLEHITGYVLRNIDAGKLKLKKIDKKVTLVDSEYLCRFSGLCSEPREVLKKTFGSNFIEMRHNKLQMLPTGEAAFLFNNSRVEGSVLGKRIAEEAETAGADIAVTLSAAAKENMQGDFKQEVLEFGEFVQKLI